MSYSTIQYIDFNVASESDKQDVLSEMRNQLQYLAEIMDTNVEILSTEFTAELNSIEEVTLGLISNYEPGNAEMMQILNYIVAEVSNLKLLHQQVLAMLQDPAKLQECEKLKVQIRWVLNIIAKALRLPNTLREI